MFTRLVRIQLVIFTIAAVVGLAVMAVGYMQAPAMLGVGRMTVTLELPRGGGLYPRSNVTYRGVQIGKVTDVTLTRTGAKATLSLAHSPKIPANLVAEVHSVSAVGEQYVDLLPRNSSAPYLKNGSVIAVQDSTVPQPVGPMLDKASELLNSIPKDTLHALVNESAKGFDDAGYDLGSLLDSASTLTDRTSSVSGEARALVDNSAPLLDGALKSADATRLWASSLAGVTDQLVNNDSQIRTLLRNGPGAFDEVSALLTQVKPTLPVLLANMTSLGKVAVTYNPSLEQLLVLVPSFFAGLGALSHIANATGLPLGDFRVGLNDPPACTVGFLPPSQWRSPADTNTVDTPDGLYCKLPQDSPIVVRGLRNLPCMAKPGKRAPTVQLCDSDQPYVPLALRQHATGPYPIDPNLLGQGIPPDSRVDERQRLDAPVEGTPMPAEVPPAPGPDAPPTSAPPPVAATNAPVPKPPPPAAPAPDAPPLDDGPPVTQGSAPGAVPNSAKLGGAAGPSVAVASYDPRTGRYLGPDGFARTESDLVEHHAAARWQDLVLSAGN